MSVTSNDEFGLKTTASPADERWFSGKQVSLSLTRDRLTLGNQIQRQSKFVSHKRVRVTTQKCRLLVLRIGLLNVCDAKRFSAQLP